MENESPSLTPSPSAPAASVAEWTSVKVYSLSVICLLVGIAFGALFHGPTQPKSAAPEVASSPAMTGAPNGMSPHAGMPGATAPADPVFEQVKKDPTNFDLLSEAGNASMKAGDPKSAEDYYSRALKVKDNLDIRTNLANAYFRDGDADRSLSELALVLKADPKNDKALYNTGVVRLMGKQDAKGAVSSWEAFLKYHPDHPHKDKVSEMIKRAKQFEAQKKS